MARTRSRRPAATSKFRFHEIPPDLLAGLKRVLLPMEWLIPPWCDHVNVWFASNARPGERATVEPDYSYRWATIWVNPSWLNGSEQERREDLIHELIHVTLKRLVPEDEDSKFHAHLHRDVIDRAEMVTQDLTYMLIRHKASRFGKLAAGPPEPERK
jgi:hypothetical protein